MAALVFSVAWVFVVICIGGAVFSQRDRIKRIVFGRNWCIEFHDPADRSDP